MKEPFIKLIDELLRIAPDVVATLENNGAGAWIVLELPGSPTWWELECRTPESIGLHIHEPGDPDDVPFGPPEKHFTSIEDALSHMNEQFQRTPA